MVFNWFYHAKGKLIAVTDLRRPGMLLLWVRGSPYLDFLWLGPSSRSKALSAWKKVEKISSCLMLIGDQSAPYVVALVPDLPESNLHAKRGTNDIPYTRALAVLKTSVSRNTKYHSSALHFLAIVIISQSPSISKSLICISCWLRRTLWFFHIAPAMLTHWLNLYPSLGVV